MSGAGSIAGGLRDFRANALIALLAALAGLATHSPAAALPVAAAASAGALLLLLARPAAWILLFLLLAVLAPPFPLYAGELELPLHPATIVFAGAVAVGWARIRDWRIAAGPALAGSVILAGALLLSVPWAFYYSGVSVGAQSLVRWLLLAQGFVVFAWAAWGPVPAGWNGARLLKCLLAAGFLSAAFALLDFVYQLQPAVRFSIQYIHLPTGVFRRAQGVFYDAGALGNFCAVMLVLIASLYGTARERLGIPRWLLWLPVPVLVSALVVSFSRSSVANLLAAIPVLLWMRRRSLSFSRSVWLGLALGAVAAVVFFLLPDEIAGRFIMRLRYSVLEFFSSPNEVLSRRLEAWRFLAALALDRPELFVLGIGYKSLPYTDYFGRPLVMDNMYLSVLLESGLPGLLALLAFCALVLWEARRLAASRDTVVAALGAFLVACWCGQMVQMLSADILTYWRVTPIFFAVLGIALRRHSRAENGNDA